MEICKRTCILLLTVLLYWSGGFSDAQDNSTVTNAPSDNSTMANMTTVAPVTTDTTTLMPSVVTTTVTNYCQNSTCKNGGNCTSYPSSYVCSCDTDWTGMNCDIKMVLFPDYKYNAWSGSTGTIIQLSPPIQFSYFRRWSNLVYVASGGYVSFGSQFNMTSAPFGTSWPFSPSLLGIYWAPNDFPNNNVSYFYYFEQDQTKIIMNNSQTTTELYKYVKKVINDSNFEPVYIAVVTYQNVKPASVERFPSESATVQAILTTDGYCSYAIKNYQFVWMNTGFFERPRVSTDYSGISGKQMKGDVPMNGLGQVLIQLFENTTTPNLDPITCVQNTANAKNEMGAEIMSLPACPCYKIQASSDGWYEMNTIPSCFQSIFDISGLKQQCCYNRFGLLETNTADSNVTIQMNSTALQSAWNQCCFKASQLCSWFYKQFPSSNCSGYIPPFTASVFGSLQFVTFDGNMFTFFGLGDFVLFKTENVEIQVRLSRNINNLNTTFMKALAIKFINNTSSFQIYLNESTISLQENTANQLIYKSVPSQSRITLLFTDFIIIVENGTAGLSCIIKTHMMFANSVGILGSLDRNSSNDFKFSNGTLVVGKADKLSKEIISEFGQSWQVLNQMDSLFNYPGALSFEEANNNTGFSPLLIPTTVTEILTYFVSKNQTAVAQELCGDNLPCLQEYYVTNNNESALAVLTQSKNIMTVNSLSAPKFNNTETSVRVDINPTDPFTLKLTVQNNTAVVFNIETNLINTSLTVAGNGTFVWNISATLDMLRGFSFPKSLKFVATDLNNLSAEYIPTINLCLCNKSSQCGYILNNVAAGSGNVNNLLCQCGERAGGKYCEVPVDVCQNCYNKTTCDASKDKYCADCPQGYGGDGKICQDINECLTKNGGCDQKCTNTPGSFICSCASGYMWNGAKCADIDECSQNPNICNSLKRCFNEPGTYKCVCLPDLVGDNCIKAPYKFIGTLSLANTGSQTWNDNLNNQNSAEFKALADLVTKSISGVLETSLPNDTFSVQTLMFSQSTAAARTKRQAVSPNSYTALYVIYLKDNSITANQLNLLLNPRNMSCNSSCPYGQITIVSLPQVNGNANLCNYPGVYLCDESTSTCEQNQQTTTCSCKPGFQANPNTFSCTDIDECSGNSSNNCTNNGDCINTYGSYMCKCSQGQYWNTNMTNCTADGCSTSPCQNGGTCYLQENPSNFICRCTYGWEGDMCQNEDSEAYRWKVAVICISVILGVLCLVLLIILIVICFRKHRTLDSDSYTNSRYTDPEPIPRAKLVHRSGNDMADNGQDNSYNRLDYTDMNDKQTVFGRHSPTPNARNGKNVYQNRAYENDASERL